MKVAKTNPTTTSSSTDVELEAFIETRGLSLAVAEQAGLYTQDGMLQIPYPNMTGTWYERQRSLRESMYLSPKGADPHLYNPLGLGPNAREVWFTEGEIDALTLIEHGVPAIASGGSSVFATRLFSEAWVLLFGKARIIIATDNDTAGDKAAMDISKMWERAERFDLGKYKDINEWHVADRDGLAQAIEVMRSAA